MSSSLQLGQINRHSNLILSTFLNTWRMTYSGSVLMDKSACALSVTPMSSSSIFHSQFEQAGLGHGVLFVKRTFFRKSFRISVRSIALPLEIGASLASPSALSSPLTPACPRTNMKGKFCSPDFFTDSSHVLVSSLSEHTHSHRRSRQCWSPASPVRPLLWPPP